MDWLSHLADAPFANILFLAGLAFLAVGVLGKIAGKIEPDKIGRAASAAVGVALICVGLYLHLSGDRQKDADKQAANSTNASPSPTPDAGHGQNVTVGPAKEPVHRTSANTVSRQPVDQGGIVERGNPPVEPVKFPSPVRENPPVSNVGNSYPSSPQANNVGNSYPSSPQANNMGNNYQGSPQANNLGNSYPSRPQVPPRIPRSPDTCRQGFVWREAFPNDHVCVTPLVRKITVVQNLQAARRRNPAGGPYGLDTCLQGYVWRETQPADHVCVTPQDRQQTAMDNAQAPFRRE